MTAVCCGLQCNALSQALAARPHSPHQRNAIHLTTAVTRHPLLLRLPRCHVCSSLVPRSALGHTWLTLLTPGIGMGQLPALPRRLG